MRALTLLLWIIPTVAAGQDRIAGLVEIPALHGPVNAGQSDQAVGPVPLFAEPNNGADTAFVVRDRRQLESREHGYEQVSAVVYALEGNSGGGLWYRLRYIDGAEPRFGWLSQADAGDYRDIHTLMKSGLTYLTDEWDGRIFQAPTLNSTSRSFADPGDRPDVRIAAIEYQDGEPWYLAVIVQGSCSGDPIRAVATGWIPAYSSAGGNTVWHYSRGC